MRRVSILSSVGIADGAAIKDRRRPFTYREFGGKQRILLLDRAIVHTKLRSLLKSGELRLKSKDVFVSRVRLVCGKDAPMLFCWRDLKDSKKYRSVISFSVS